MSTRLTLLQSLALGVVLALALRLFGGKRISAKPESGRASHGASLEEIDAYLEQQMARLNIPGAALAIVEGDKIVHLRGFD